MLRKMRLVTYSEFSDSIRNLIVDRGNAVAGSVGLYAEREIATVNGSLEPLFSETQGKVRRATGRGPLPIKPLVAQSSQVGSEGIVAQLITELCREFPRLFYSHPGPDLIRKKRIRRLFIVSDFVGSGKRASAYLQSAWSVRSVRSWWSARSRKGVSWEVISFAATTLGRKTLEMHPALPQLHVVAGCPTIDTVFNDEMRPRVRGLCIRLDPVNHDVVESLGFRGAGVLLAFAHGIPNNAPRILHKWSKNWAPLFPGRVTAQVREKFETERDAGAIASRLEDLGHRRLAAGSWIPGASAEQREIFLVLAALGRSPRFDEVLSRKTGLTVLEVRRSIIKARSHDFIDGERRLTSRGQAELALARRALPRSEELPIVEKPFYYPKRLRAPRAVPS